MRAVNRSTKNGREAEKLLARHLDDRFTLVHHVRLRGLKSLVDAVLVGPQGVTVLAVAGDTDRVRCLGDHWYVWNSKTDNFDPAPHNPVKKVQTDRAAMEAHVAAWQMGSTMPVDCAVMIPRPNAQVEYMQAAVPILDPAGIVEFTQQLAQQRELVEWTLADSLLKSLGVTPQGKPWAQLMQSAGRTRVRSARGLWGLTRPQLILLGVIAAADMLLLLAGFLILFLR